MFSDNPLQALDLIYFTSSTSLSLSLFSLLPSFSAFFLLSLITNHSFVLVLFTVNLKTTFSVLHSHFTGEEFTEEFAKFSPLDSPMGKTQLAPGFRFHPTDVELVRYYLKRKVLGKKLLVDAIAEVDIYKFEPSDLPGIHFKTLLVLLRKFFMFLDIHLILLTWESLSLQICLISKVGILSGTSSARGKRSMLVG